MSVERIRALGWQTVEEESNMTVIRLSSMKVAAFLMSGLFTVLAHAVPVQDQSFDPGSFLSFSGITSEVDKAQTFTVGIGGTLIRIELDLETASNSQSPLLFDVRATSSGVPLENDATTLASITIPAGNVPLVGAGGFVPVDLTSFGITVTPGEVLAIVLRSDSVWPGYIWAAGGDLYPGGDEYFRHPSIGITTWTDTHGDNGFKTFVDPSVGIPEPTTLLLLGIGLASLGFLRIIRRRNTYYLHITDSTALPFPKTLT